MKVSLCTNGAYWQARWRINGASKGKGLGKRAEVTREEALEACRRLESSLSTGPTSPSVPTLGAWITTFLELRPDLSPQSAGLYRACGARLVKFFGADIASDRVSALDAARFRAMLGGDDSTLGQYSIYRICSEARSIFQAAADADLIVKNPFAKAMPPKPKLDEKWSYLSLTDCDRLIEHSTGPWRVLWGLLRLGGLRINEALSLTWLRVDLVRRRLTVAHAGRYQSTKKRTREVPICPRLHDLLFEASMGQDHQGDRILSGIRQGNAWRGMTSICLKSGIEPWARLCHTLRKNCLTDWAEVHPVHVCASFAGNSSQVALERYLQAKDDDFQKACSTPIPTATVAPCPAKSE